MRRAFKLLVLYVLASMSCMAFTYVHVSLILNNIGLDYRAKYVSLILNNIGLDYRAKYVISFCIFGVY